MFVVFARPRPDSRRCYHVCMTVGQERVLAALSPMWQRIARGEVDLSRYSDEEVLTGRIGMPDGRTLPQPPVYPDTWIAEQARRQVRKAHRLIRENVITAIEVHEEIMVDDTLEPRDRMKAASFFTDRFLGKDVQRVQVEQVGDDPRELLIQRLLAARSGLPAAQVAAVANGGVIDAEIVPDDAVLGLDDLI